MHSTMLLCLATVLLALPLAGQEEPDSTQSGPLSGYVQYYNNTAVNSALVKVCSYYCTQVWTGYGSQYQFTPGSYPITTGTLSFYAYIGDPWNTGGQWG